MQDKGGERVVKFSTGEGVEVKKEAATICNSVSIFTTVISFQVGVPKFQEDRMYDSEFKVLLFSR